MHMDRRIVGLNQLTDILIDREACRLTDRWTDRQTGMKTDRHRDKETHRHTDTQSTWINMGTLKEGMARNILYGQLDRQTDG